MPDDRLQDGIYFRSGQRRPACYRLVLANFRPRIGQESAYKTLVRIAAVVEELRTGTIRDVAGQDQQGLRATAAEFQGLSMLLGYGRRLFDSQHHSPLLTIQARPEFLEYLRRGGDPFPSIPWTATAFKRDEADICLQLTAPSEAAVNRAAVEIWKLSVDEALPVEFVASYSGFARSDGRGWLEFHDGVSNIEASERLVAIRAGGDPSWMDGGSYMAFLRFIVDLRAWRSLPQAQQELIIGRDKPSGRPVAAVGRTSSGEALPILEPDGDSDQGEARTRSLADYREPSPVDDPLVEASHLQRANRNRVSPSAPAGQRIFRQGYEFLDDIGPEGPQLGLNFVSFQSDLSTLRNVLHLPGWLADVNFGGPAEPGPGDPQPIRVVSLAAGGFYAVPPTEEPFPGAGLVRG